MGKNICKAVSIIMAILVVIAVYGALTAIGSGFLDLSNIGRYFLFGFAAIFALIGIATGLKGWKK